jgi:M6 family metalloprotease-like protein
MFTDAFRTSSTIVCLLGCIALGCGENAATEQSVAAPLPDRGALDPARTPGSEHALLGYWYPHHLDQDAQGEQRVLTIMANFADTSFTEPTIATVDDALSGSGASGPSVDDYYREVSYGQMWMPGEVYPDWVQLSEPQHCRWQDWASEAMALVDDDVDFTEYDLLVFLAPAGDCAYKAFSWAGRDTVETSDGPVRLGLVFGDLDVNPDDYWETSLEYVLIHEIGHTLGVEHQGLELCNPTSISTPSNCNWIDWIGKLGPMSNPNITWPTHFNAHHKNLIGWMDHESMPTVTESGLYELQPIACHEGSPAGCPDSTLPRALRIPRANRYPRRDLYIEYRQPVGYDAAVPSVGPDGGNNFVDGAMAHVSRGLFSAQLDASVSADEPASVYQAALPPPQDPLDPLPHEVFTDPESGTTFTTVEASPERLVVDIQLGSEIGRGPELDILAPDDGDTVSGAVKITAHAVDQSDVVSVDATVSWGDETVFESPMTGTPYSTTWTVDPTTHCGSLDIDVIAEDGAGYRTTERIDVMVECADTDDDGIIDIADNCPLEPNTDQFDYDADGIGSACDACPADAENDADGDGHCAAIVGDLAGDTCVDLVDQSAFADSLYSDGDDMSGDLNGDGVVDLSDVGIFSAHYGMCADNCPIDANPDQTDTDGDHRGDVCDFPHVVSTIPAQGATDVSTFDPVQITFDVPIALSTFEATFEPETPHGYSLSADGRTVTIAHSPFVSFEEYELTVSSGVESVDGDIAPDDYVLSFTTGM